MPEALNDQQLAENTSAMREASRLAQIIYKRYYQKIAPNWQLLDTPAGIISQIDNMVAGILEDTDTLRAENATLKDERDWHSVDDADNLSRCLCILGISSERYNVIGYQHWTTPEFQRAVRHVLAGVPDLFKRIVDENATLRDQLTHLEEALTPSTDTKVAYMSEVKDGGRFVSWEAIKDIMAMIRARANYKENKK